MTAVSTRLTDLLESMRNRRAEHWFVYPVQFVVVVGVIGIMFLWIISWGDFSRASARSTSCSSNIRQLATAFRAYAMDYDGWGPTFPEASWADPFERVDFVRRTLMPYIRNQQVLSCPEVSGYDAGQMNYYYVPGYGLASRPDAVVFYDDEYRHLGGANFGFVDSHVRRCLPQWAPRIVQGGGPP